MVTDINLVPVVQTGPLEMSVIYCETQGMDQVQSYFSGSAQPGNIPCIGGDLRLIKDHMEVGIFKSSVPYPGNIIRHGTFTILPLPSPG